MTLKDSKTRKLQNALVQAAPYWSAGTPKGARTANLATGASGRAASLVFRSASAKTPQPTLALHVFPDIYLCHAFFLPTAYV